MTRLAALAVALSLQAPAFASAHRNPVIPRNAPDPDVISVREGAVTRYYLVATSWNDVDAFPIFSSTDLEHWKEEAPMWKGKQRPAWGKSDFWAPEIHDMGEDASRDYRYVAYYTAREKTSGQLTIAAATAKKVTGPWRDRGPWLRGAASTPAKREAGVIDGHQFRDPKTGTRYFYWKIDGNDVKEPCIILGQRLSADGLRREGEPMRLLKNDLPREGAVIEAPWMDYQDGYYYLYYSMNAFNTKDYAVGVARSRAPLGPFEKLPQPVLQSNHHLVGPGHNSIVEHSAGKWMVYHVMYPQKADGSHRMVAIDRIEYRDGWPHVNDGTPSH